MEISAKTHAKLMGVSTNHILVSSRSLKRIKERKLRKELGSDFSQREIETIAKHDTRNRITITY